MVFQLKDQSDRAAITMTFKNARNRDAEQLIMDVESELTEDVLKRLEGKTVCIQGDIPVELGIYLGHVLKKSCLYIQYKHTFCV